MLSSQNAADAGSAERHGCSAAQRWIRRSAASRRSFPPKVPTRNSTNSPSPAGPATTSAPQCPVTTFTPSAAEPTRAPAPAAVRHGPSVAEATANWFFSPRDRSPCPMPSTVLPSTPVIHRGHP
ncbi:hypothetical protein GCM10020229_65230 [Kitasatospora albolonga]